MDQGLTEEKIIKLVEFILPDKYKKYMLVQGFDSYSKSLNKHVEFYKRLKNSKEIFQDEGDIMS